MLLKIRNFLLRIPYIGCFFQFSLSSHKKALIKFSVLYVISSAPLLVTIILSKSTEDGMWKSIQTVLENKISVSEQFVYTAAFLAPTIYLLVEKFLAINADHKTLDGIRQASRVYKGYWYIFITSLILLFLTAIAYSFIKTNNNFFSGTLLNKLLSNNAVWIYLFSIAAFYLSIVQGMGDVKDYFDTTESDEKSTLDRFDSRLAGRGITNE